MYREHRFDVLHCHTVYPAGYVAARWCESRGVPLVITSHGCDISPDSRLMIKARVPGRVAYVLGQAALLVAISDLVERQYLRRCPRASRIARIPNGVDQRLRHAGPASGRHSARTLPARVLPVSGTPGPPQRSRLAPGCLSADCPRGRRGTGHCRNGRGRGGAENQGRESDLADRVHFPGVVRGLEKVYLLQNCLGTVVPSRISESFSLVVLESRAAGVPVIGSRIPVLTDFIATTRSESSLH